MGALVLAQLITGDVRPLESDAGLVGGLVESPGVLLMGIGVAGAVSAWVLAQRGLMKWALGSLVAAGVLAGVLAGAARLVETPRERVRDLTRDFVAAVAEGRPERVAALTSERVVIRSGGRDAPLGRGFLVSAARGAGSEIEGFRVSPRGARMAGSGRVLHRFSVRTDHTGAVSNFEGPVGSWWEVEWGLDSDGSWRLLTLDCLSIRGQDPGGAWIDWGRRVGRGERE